MNGVMQVVGLWPNRNEDVSAEGAPLDLSDFAVDEVEDDEPPERDLALVIGTALCSLLAVSWLSWIGSIYIPRWLATAPTADMIAAGIATACSPLVVIGLIYALVTRNSRSMSRQMTDASALMRSEQSRLEAALAHVSNQLAHEQTELSEANDKLMTLGEEAVHRMKVASVAMRDEVETLNRYGQSLKFSATSARADLAVLLADLPKAQLETRHMVSALQEAGVTAHERAGALDAQLASLTQRGREADEIAGGAAQKLAAHLSRVESVSANAGQQLEDAASKMTDAIDAALDRAATAGDMARQNMDAQGAAMVALVDQTQAALARTGADSADAIAKRVDDVTEKLEAMGALLASQSETTSNLLNSVRENLDGVDHRLEALDDKGVQRAERLTKALAALDQHAAALTGSLATGTTTADTLISRTESLMTALDASVREIDETLPAAFDRLDAKAVASRATVSEAGPIVTQIERDASSALDRLIEAEALIAKHRDALGAIATDTESRLLASGDAAARLVEAVESAEATTRIIAEGAGAQLVEAMVRVRETANTAAERAREAIGAVIPEATAQFSAASREALTKAITDEVQAQIADLSATAEQAVETASKASDKLMRQMLTIAETSAAVEARIAEARDDVERSDRDNFARRVALLIESLNSTAIDVTKIMSNDVTDSAWASYLRGDRGVFTRRAVRLLDSGEVKEIVRKYDEESDFREQVNRYIHDFEAMLRNVLATRDGSALGVTLLSSDMGKLYVALAQAIERLRS
jgi:outer membrane lipoprotein-sorting protein